MLKMFCCEVLQLLVVHPVTAGLVVLPPQLRQFPPLHLHLALKLQQFDLNVHLQCFSLMRG